MKCYYCGASLDYTDVCPDCDADVHIWKKVNRISNHFYNEGLSRAQVRDLSGAIASLQMSLRYNKQNIEARNLLGLVYYEMGETVNALSEWVISKSMMPADNPASDFLVNVQKSKSELEKTNQTIKKFNQSLTYCRDGNYDLAVIQLKKVIDLNPRMVKGHQLLALLYMREERYDLAMRSLRHAEKIDVNNTNTMRYKMECKEHLKANGKLKHSREEEDTVTYQSGNDIIIRPAKFTDNSAVKTVVSLLIGAAIGIAVVCFLVIPEVRQQANSDASAQLVEANQTISTREQTISGLEDEIESLNEQLSSSETATDSAQSQVENYSSLLSAYVSYAEEDYTTASELLAEVDSELLDDNGKSLYDTMVADMQEETMAAALEEGLDLYMDKDYEGAIEKFLTIAETDPSYEDGKVDYYLAFAYNYLEDYENALKWFQITLENTSDSRMKSTSTSMSEDLIARGYSVAE
ncbi:MAG: hypothetical protein LUD01_03810 [Clostridiales bacterium]|nr:hypothetical protein [Clostridiales bacterium]